MILAIEWIYKYLWVFVTITAKIGFLICTADVDIHCLSFFTTFRTVPGSIGGGI